LVLHRNDFKGILKEPLERQKEDHQAFCQNLDLLRDYPCHILNQPKNHLHFYYQYFKKGSVIVKNAFDTKHLVIVKSGKCQIVINYTSAFAPTNITHSKYDEYEAKFPLILDDIRRKTLLKGSNLMLEMKRDDVRGAMMGSLMPDILDEGEDSRTKMKRLSALKDDKDSDEERDDPEPYRIGAAVARNQNSMKEEEAQDATRNAIARTWKKLMIKKRTLRMIQRKRKPIKKGY